MTGDSKEAAVEEVVEAAKDHAKKIYRINYKCKQ